MPLTPVGRRLSTRRSSACAPDPWNKAYRDDIQSTSTLTIVKVVQQPLPDFNHRPSSPNRGRSFKGRTRADHHQQQQQQQQQQSKDGEQQRMTFAFNAFQPNQAGSPPSSPRLRPSSPHRNHSHRSVPQPRLGPDQIVELAKSSINGSQVPTIPAKESFQPATFTPLPDNIYLPFIDRPAEVSALISTHPSVKLFSLLAQTFPPSSLSDDDEISTDPTKWTYAHLHAHLTQATRQQVPDDIWVLKARKAILSHSELIWERVKGALGVPPELDVDYPIEDWVQLFSVAPEQEEVNQTESPPSNEEENVKDSEISAKDPPLSSARSARSVRSNHSISSINTDDIPDDHGYSARGHWEDWDAIMDSPIWVRPKSRLAQDPTSPVFPAYGDYDIERPPSPSNLLSIEPLLVNTNATSPMSNTAPPPVSHAGVLSNEIPGMGLDNIQEGAEEEEETATPVPTQEPQKSTEEEGLVAPQDIQGLRISTSPAHPPMSPSALRSIVPLGAAVGPMMAQNVSSIGGSGTSPGAAGISIPHSSSDSSLSAVAQQSGVPSPISPLPPYYPGYGVPVTGVSLSPSSIYAASPFFFGPVSSNTSASSTKTDSSSASPTIPPAAPKSRPHSGFAPGSFRRSGSFGSLGSLRDLGNFPMQGQPGHLRNMSVEDSGSERSFYSNYAAGGGEGRGPRFPSSFAQARRAAGAKSKEMSEIAASAGIGIGRKPRTLSQSSSTSIPASGLHMSPLSTTIPLGGSVAGYKRLSWGPQQPSGLSVLAQQEGCFLNAGAGGEGSGTTTTVVGSPI